MLGQSRPKPPLLAAVAVCLLVAAAYVVIRLYVFSERLVPLTYALPLLVGLWHRNRALNVAQIIFYFCIATLNVIVAGTPGLTDEIPNLLMMYVNILIAGWVVDSLITSREQLVNANQGLQRANAELEASNEELASRDEEISSQNEELQQQAEELEQQTAELQQQTEELQQQAEELQQLHLDSSTRAHLLQALLNVTTALPADAKAQPLDQVCAAAASAFGIEPTAALLFYLDGCELQLTGQSGVGSDQAALNDWASDPFIQLVCSDGRTACIEDLAQLDGHAERPFGSILAAPLRTDGQVDGVLAVLGHKPRAWSEAEFGVIRWFAAQASLALRTVRLQDELDERSRQAEEASRQKTRFLAAVSHDVRNPANAINLMAELIQRAGENPQLMSEVPQLAEGLRSNARLLVELVSDVLDLSRLNSGKIDIEESVFDLAELLRAEVGQYATLAQTGGLALVVEVVEAETLRVRTDRMKLARVLGNLVGNAIKFTEVGSVRATLCRLTDGPLEISVTDTGVGIAPEHLEHIFDEFYQIKNPERDRSKGTGLGLAICKRLVDAIGCSLSVRSEVGAGTTFTLRLPSEMLTFADEPAPPASEAVVRAEDHQLSGLSVLVVEDHETTRHAVTRLLAAHGATVDAAEDGRAALRYLRHEIHDVVLLDLMLPDMDGRDILRQLREQRPQRLRCILAVSGDVSEQRRAEIESLGANTLIAKPVEMDQLVRRIATTIGSSDTTESRG